MKKTFKINIIILLMTIFVVFSNFNPILANQTGIPLRNSINDNFAGIKLKGGIKIDHEQQVVTLNLRDSDLRQTLRMLADKAGMNVIIHDSVSGTISLDLVKVDLNRAFEYIMTMNNLTYWKDGNTLIIADNETAVDLGINIAEIKSIKIKYVDAQRIANFLNKNVFSINRPNTSTSSIVTTNPSTNEVLVFGSDNDIQLAEEVIEYLDVKPQIRNFEVNYASPVALASKICWTVFKSDDGEEDFSKEADLEEGSETTLVCGKTSEIPETSESDVLEDFNTASYWVLADTGLNQITIYGGTSEQLNMAEEIVNNFDKREPQVYLEVSIIELNLTDTKSLEFHYALEKNGSQAMLTEGTFTIGNLNSILSNGRAYIVPGTNSEKSFLQTVMTESKARLLANPRIISANNTESTVKISEEVIESVTSVTDGNGVVTNQVSIGDGDSIEFSILPKISPNGYVTLSLPDFTLNSLAGKSTLGDTEANLKNTREVGVKSVRIKDGDTFVIGGLIQEREQLTHQKVPVLGELPVIGILFQNQSTSKIRSEIIIMITPKIIDEQEIVESI